MKRGWWSLQVTMHDESHDLSDCTLEHIAEQIKIGMTSGEVIEHDEEELTA